MEEMTARLEGVFTSKRLVYCAIEDIDAHKDFLFKAIQSDPVNAAFGSSLIPRPASKKDAAKEVQAWIDAAMLSVLICLRPEENHTPSEGEGAGEGEGQKEMAKASEPTPIGYLALAKVPEILAHSRKTTIGLQIAKQYQNKGYGAEAINWALDWAFRFANVHRFGIGAVSFNDRAIALYKKLGFVEEGVRREMIYFDMRWWDLVEFSMLDREWKALRGLN
jgi:RimJ/RimL family protein N-acetyltransferase